MSLKGLFAEIVDDVLEIVTPVVARFSGGSRRVAVANGDEIEIYEVAGERARRIEGRDAGSKVGQARLHGELRLPAVAVQSQTLTLPAATHGYVEPVLDHRLEKLTPWAPERVVYGYRVAGETEDGSIRIAFAATARDIADAWVAKADACGFTATALGSAADPIDRPIGVDLWRGSRDGLRSRLRRTLAVAAILPVAVCLPALAGSFWMLSGAEERLQSIEARAAKARNALRTTAGADSRETALIQRKRPETALITLIDRIALALPDGAVLRELEIDPEKVRIAGSSHAAPALLGLLGSTGMFGEARFSAPVTRNADGKDGFEILANRIQANPAPIERGRTDRGQTPAPETPRP